MDEVLELLDKTAKRYQKNAEETKEKVSKLSALYEELQQSAQATQEQKLKTFVKKTIQLDRLERLNSQLSLLYILQIFAFKVKVLEVSVGKMKDQLVKLGVLQSSAELEDIKKNIDALKILIEAQYEALKDINDKQNQNLAYIY